MFGANTMDVYLAASTMAALPAASKPVVPMIILMLLAAQYFRCSSVPSGRVKSIRNWEPARPFARSDSMAIPAGLPRNAAASVPMAGDAGISSAPDNCASSALRMASTSMWPIRPDAPATAIFIGFIVRPGLSRWMRSAFSVARISDTRAVPLFLGFPGLVGDARQIVGFGRQIAAAFITGDEAVLEIDGHAAGRDFAVALLQAERVIPAVGVEDVVQQRRAEQEGDLILRHPRFQL